MDLLETEGPTTKSTVVSILVKNFDRLVRPLNLIRLTCYAHHSKGNKKCDQIGYTKCTNYAPSDTKCLK